MERRMAVVTVAHLLTALPTTAGKPRLQDPQTHDRSTESHRKPTANPAPGREARRGAGAIPLPPVRGGARGNPGRPGTARRPTPALPGWSVAVDDGCPQGLWVLKTSQPVRGLGLG